MANSPLQSVMQGEISSVTRRYSDIILAAGVMMVIGMMIIPLPTFLLDLLLVVNITVQVSMLLIAIYISDALKLAAFPTIILITTLYRLALNVSSTRLILLQAACALLILRRAAALCFAVTIFKDPRKKNPPSCEDQGC